MTVCFCNDIDDAALQAAIRNGAEKTADVYRANACAPRCGACVPRVREALAAAEPDAPCRQAR